MLKINNIHKSYGSQVLFDGISLQMNPGERLGLVGRNGHGKSTLFKIILGQEEADEGGFSIPKNYQIGHLAQHLKFTEPYILQEACLGLPASEKDDQYKAEAILFGLGFAADDMWRAPEEFSGGFQIRLNLAKVLLSKPHLLLLDEPTNYLDIVSMRWLVKYLKNWPGEMIIISHDRDFMDAVTTHTAAIHRQNLKRIEGDTSKLYAQIIQDEEVYEKTRQNDLKKRKDMEVFINRFRAKANKASVVQSRIKMRDKLPSLEKLSDVEGLDFEFRHKDFPAKTLLEVKDLKFGFSPEDTLIEDVSFLLGKSDRIAIVGKNGKGKSTLLNLLAGELSPQEGEIKMHPQTQLGYFGQTNVDRLHEDLTIEQEITAANPELGRTIVRNICGTMMFDGDKAGKEISVLSGGEKSRVLLGKILATPSNLLFLDEPTNHLDMESIQALSESIQNYPGAVVLVTHNETLLRELATRLVVFHGGGVEVFNGDYEDFLEKIGWEDEAKPKKKNKKKKQVSRDDKKEQDKQLRKKEKQLKSIESDISKFEDQLRAKEQEIQTLGEAGDPEKLLKLSGDMGAIQEKIDRLYQQWQEIES